MRGYEVVIGIETHVQLATQSKIFSGAATPSRVVNFSIAGP